MFSKMRFRAGVSALLAFTFVVGLGLTGLAQDSRARYSSRQSGERSWTVPEDTVISMSMRNTLTSRTARVGDKFTATVTIPVYVNGRTVIPAGSTVEGRVTQVTPAKRMSKSGAIGIDFDTLVFPNGSRVGLVGSLTSDDPGTRDDIDDEGRVSGGDENRKAVFIGGGGAIGAVLGGMAGGGKGAVLGGIAGAGAGVAGVLLSKGEEAQVPSGTRFGIQLRQPLVVTESNWSEGAARSTRDSYPPAGRQDRRNPQDRTYRDDPIADNSDPDDAQPERVEPVTSRTESARNDRPELVRPNREAPRASNPRPSNPSTSSPRPSNPAPALPLSSQEMIRRAQVALREQGYYEGETDGMMGSRTSNALKTYQREHSLPETGDLDPQTAKSLGILGGVESQDVSGPSPASSRPDTRPAAADIVAANVLSATATRTSDGSINVLINTQANTGGWRWFGEHVVNGDTLEVYARAERPTGMVTQALTRGRIELNVRTGVDYVRRVVVHGAGGNLNIGLTNSPDRATRPVSNPAANPILNPAAGANLQRQAEQLLSEYQRAIGVRHTGTGIELANGKQYNDAEIGLLFALDSFTNAAQLYSRLLATLQDQEGLRSATLAMARQARRTDLVLTSTPNWPSFSLDSRWDGIRQDVLRLIRAFNIDPSELDN